MPDMKPWIEMGAKYGMIGKLFSQSRKLCKIYSNDIQILC